MRRTWLALLAGVAVGALASAPGHSAPSVLGSTAISWEEIQALPSGTGITKAKQVFKAPTATLDELELHVSTLPVGQAPHAPHKHPDEELIIIKEGTVEVMVGGVTKRVGPGSVILQASNQMHAMRNVGDVPAVYHVIRWNSPGMLEKNKAKAD
jgi:XRE family transcriptional regulator, regulator of sulfur utilization